MSPWTALVMTSPKHNKRDRIQLKNGRKINDPDRYSASAAHNGQVGLATRIAPAPKRQQGGKTPGREHFKQGPAIYPCRGLRCSRRPVARLIYTPLVPAFSTRRWSARSRDRYRLAGEPRVIAIDERNAPVCAIRASLNSLVGYLWSAASAISA